MEVYGFCIRTLHLPVISVMIIGDGKFRHHLFQAGIVAGWEFLSDAPFSNLVSAQKFMKRTAHASVGGVVPMNPQANIFIPSTSKALQGELATNTVA